MAVMFKAWGWREFCGRAQLGMLGSSEQEGKSAGRGPLDQETQGKAPALVFANLSVSTRKDEPLVQNVTGAVHKGEICAVMGLSGCGKTTFLKALHGEHAANTKMTGEVLLGEGCKLGYMSDDELLLENLTVRETLRYALLLLNPQVSRDVITKKVESAAKQVGLERCVDTFVKNISWGERKRLQVAQQIVWSCNIIVMDEPLTGLDSVSALKVAWALQDCAKQRRFSFVYSVHQPRHEIYKTFNKLVILDHNSRGQMVYSGPAAIAPNFFLDVHVHTRQATMGFDPQDDAEFQELADEVRNAVTLDDEELQADHTIPPKLLRELSARSIRSNYSAHSEHPTPGGGKPTHTSRRTRDFIEPAHFLIDAITFANNEEFVTAARRYSNEARHVRMQSTQYSVTVGLKLFGGGNSRAGNKLNLVDAFQKSQFYKSLEDEVRTAREYGNMEPMYPTHPSPDNMILRALISSSRWYLDLWRDRRAFFIQLGLGWIVALVLGSCFYELGDDEINVDYPTNKAAIMYSIAAMIIALNQFPIAQYCNMFRVYVRERYTGLRSDTEFALEALLCTWWYGLYFAILSLVTYAIATPSASNFGLTFGNSVILSLSGLAIGWLCSIGASGHAVQAISIYAMLEAVMLGSDGFVIPTAYIRPIWIWFYYCNPRTWYLKAELIDVYCDGSCPDTDNAFSSDDVDRAQLREDLVYGWVSDIAQETDFSMKYYSAYLINYFNLWGEDVDECIGYSLVIFAVLLAAVYLLLKAESQYTALLRIQLSPWMSKLVHSHITLNALMAVTALLIFILSATVKDYSYYKLSELYTGDPSFGYEPLARDLCPTCYGLANIEQLRSDIVGDANFDIMISRMDHTTNYLMQTVPERDQLIADANMFHVLDDPVDVTAIEDFLDFAPITITSHSSDLEATLQLKNAESHVAMIFGQMGSNMFELLTSMPPTNEFWISGNAGLEDYTFDTYGVTLEEALDAKRLYVFTRLPGFDDLPTANHVGAKQFLDVNPHVLFIRNETDGQLETLAIQLGSNPGTYPVMYPGPGSVSGYTWDAARAFARHAISMRGVLAHIVDIHHLIHAFAPAVAHMPKKHPIAQVMRPSVDVVGLRVLVEVLLSPDIAPLPYVGIDTQSVLAFLAKMEDEVVFYRDANYESFAKLHGIWDLDDGLDMPLRPFLQQFWNLTIEYADNIVEYAYPTEQSVLGDGDLAQWAKKVSSPTGGNVKELTASAGVSPNCVICSKDELKNLLASYFFTTIRHSCSRFPQLTFDLFYYPLAAWNLKSETLPSPLGPPFTAEAYLNLFREPEGIVQGFRFLTATAVPVQTDISNLPGAIDNSDLQLIADDFTSKLKALTQTYEDQFDMFIWRRLELYAEN